MQVFEGFKKELNYPHHEAHIQSAGTHSWVRPNSAMPT